jgi:hypothetical protein
MHSASPSIILRRQYSQTLQIEDGVFQTLCGYRTNNRKQAFLFQSKGSSHFWDSAEPLGVGGSEPY